MNENQPPTEESLPEERDERTPGVSSEPDWLRELSGDQESPDWLRRLFDDEQPEGGVLPSDREQDLQEAPADAAPAPADAESAAEPESAEPEPEERPNTDDLRRWFRETVDEQGAPPADREEMPDWLQALDATTPPADETEEPDEDDVPDWLRALDDVPPPAAGPKTEPEEGETEEPSFAAISDELTPISPEWTSSGDLPDWLQRMTQEVAGPPLDQGLPLAGELPDQEDVGAAREPPRETEPELPPPDVPEDWAGQQEPQAPEPEEPWTEEEPERAPSLAAPDRATEPEPPVEDEERALPGLIASDEEPEQDLWLADLGQEPEVETELPEWMAAPEEGPEPEGAFLGLIEGEQPAGAVTPDWIRRLRSEQGDAGDGGTTREGAPTDGVAARGALERGAAERGGAVESSGPLAGLSGLLSPQPVAGLASRSEFRPEPPVPDEQHALAARIRELLSEPPARPTLPAAAPGRPVVRALGRWLIYLALIAVIVAAMFVPALYERILPPETEGGQDFYNTLRALPPGSEVLLVVDYDAARDGELTPLTRTLLWHLVTSGQRVVVVSHTPQGAAIVQDLLDSRALWAYGPAPAAGVHALNLGYLPPHPAAMQAFMANPLGGAAMWGADALPEETELGRAIAQFSDLDAIVLVSASQEHTRWWIEQTSSSRPAPSLPMLAGLSASIAPALLPYSAPGAQLSGTLVGLAGAAEYERLCGAGFVPNARQNMILQGSAQMLLAAIVLVSGISAVLRAVAFGRKG